MRTTVETVKGEYIVTPAADVEAPRTHEMSSDTTVGSGGLRRWLQFGPGNPRGATQRGGEMGVTVTAGRARARRRTLRAPPAARRIELPQILQIIVGVRDSRMAQLQMSPRRRWASAPTGAGVAAGCTRATAHIAVLVSTQCDRVGSQRRRHQRWKNDIYRGTSGAKQEYAHWRFFPGPATCTGNTTGKLT